MDTRSNAAAPVSATPGFRPDIAALRALAVAAVVMFHYGISAVPGGFVGVDVFFVISGFLMTSILAGAAVRGRVDIVGFYLGRIRRIMPALVVVTLCTLAAGFLFLLPPDFEQLAWDAVWSDTFLINLVFAHTNDYFGPAADQSWFLHCWSLAVEIQFYLVIPFVVLLATRFAPWRGVRVSLLVIAALSLFASYLQTRMDAASAFYQPTARAWEFAAGGLVFTLRPLAVRRGVVAVTGLVLILAAIARYDGSIAYPGLWPLAPVVGAALVLWAGVDNRLVSAAPVQALGNISYSVYLWHWPVLMVCGGLLPGGGPIAIAVEIVAALALSVLTYRYVETPFRSRGPGAGTWHFTAVAAGLCGVALASGTVIALGGLPGRIPADIRRIVDLTPPERDWRSGTCFLSADQGFADLGADCLAKTGDTRPRLLLWGDSTVADLYPGVTEQPWAKDFAIEQATAASCAHYGSPIVSSLPHCQDFQSSILSYVLTEKPRYVILSMSRNDYGPRFDTASQSTRLSLIDPMVDLIRKLKSDGVAHVIVAGPVPFWAGGMPATFALESFGAKTLEPTLRLRALDRIRQWDATVRAAATGAGAEYLSFVDRLCHGDRCMALIPGAISPSLLQFDMMHFTTKGSAYVANHLIGPILGETVSASDDLGGSEFDPVIPATPDRSRQAAPPSALPQHYPLTLGASFKIDVVVAMGQTQVPHATILQDYDSDLNGFSIEYSAPDRATLYVRLDDRTIYASAFDVTPETPHRFEMMSQAGHPTLTLDGRVVAQNKDKTMTQSPADLWVGGSGIFPDRDLDGKLTGLRVSGDAERH